MYYNDFLLWRTRSGIIFLVFYCQSAINYAMISCRYTTRWENRSDTGYGRFTRGPRLYGQPRDFRRFENQFLNERGFSRTINGEYRATRGASSYTYGDAYRLNDFRESPRDRRGSVSSQKFDTLQTLQPTTTSALKSIKVVIHKKKKHYL